MSSPNLQAIARSSVVTPATERPIPEGIISLPFCESECVRLRRRRRSESPLEMLINRRRESQLKTSSGNPARRDPQTRRRVKLILRCNPPGATSKATKEERVRPRIILRVNKPKIMLRFKKPASRLRLRVPILEEPMSTRSKKLSKFYALNSSGNPERLL